MPPVLPFVATLAALAIAIPAVADDRADPPTAAGTQVHYRHEQVGDVRVFYREAGDRSAPTVLLLHGFAASSYMYRDLIPALADRYHVVAPDLPAFGYTQSPARGDYDYPFANLTTPPTPLP